jgi:hypothetical protein
VTITGTNFFMGSQVDFGATIASFTVNSETSITAVSPPGEGTVDVTVTNNVGETSATSGADRFKYGPHVYALSPGYGPAEGGTSVNNAGRHQRHQRCRPILL